MQSHTVAWEYGRAVADMATAPLLCGDHTDGEQDVHEGCHPQGRVKHLHAIWVFGVSEYATAAGSSEHAASPCSDVHQAQPDHGGTARQQAVITVHERDTESKPSLQESCCQRCRARCGAARMWGACAAAQTCCATSAAQWGALPSSRGLWLLYWACWSAPTPG